MNYELELRLHLRPFFGGIPLADVAARPELVDGYIATKTAEGLAAKTIRNHLTTLSVMFKVAARWGLVERNPCESIDLPRVDTAEMNVLSEAEVGRLLTAYGEQAGEADEEERTWWLLARRLTVLALATAMRRGELLGLRWGDVALLDGILHVRQAFVRNEITTPKSKASRRTIELGPRAIEALQEHWQATTYRSDADLVFGHPLLGTPADPGKLSGYMKAALKRAGIVKPFRPWHGPPPHGLDSRGGGREPAGVHSAQGRPLARHYHGALYPRLAGALSGCRGAR